MTQLHYDSALDPIHPPDSYDEVNSSFFRRSAGSSPQLPTTAAVQARSETSSFGKAAFQELGVFVKFGPDHRVSIEEAQTMQAIRRAFSGIPIPEFFGWRKSGKINFIYMSLVPGVTLKSAWPYLTAEERLAMAGDLSHILGLLRAATFPTTKQYIGSICGTRVQGSYFRDDPGAGPFENVKDFNDRLMFLSARHIPLSERQPDLVRALLPDTAKICFSHGDLHFDNIMICGEPGSRSIAAIIDWGDSGWYLEYFEYCMMALGTEELLEEWLKGVMKPYPNEIDAYESYWHCSPP